VKAAFEFIVLVIAVSLATFVVVAFSLASLSWVLLPVALLCGVIWWLL
jgi:hypothetical protein